MEEGEEEEKEEEEEEGDEKTIELGRGSHVKVINVDVNKTVETGKTLLSQPCPLFIYPEDLHVS